MKQSGAEELHSFWLKDGTFCFRTASLPCLPACAIIGTFCILYIDEGCLFMIDVNDLRKGVTFELDSGLYKVLEYSHHKPGRGNATIQLKPQFAQRRND
jgi:hypothetical protein